MLCNIKEVSNCDCMSIISVFFKKEKLLPDIEAAIQLKARTCIPRSFYNLREIRIL